MTIAIHEQPEAASGSAPASLELELLSQFQTELLQLVASARSKQQLLTSVADLVRRNAELEAMYYFERDSQGQLTAAVRLHPIGTDSQTDRHARQLSAACQAACRNGRLELWQKDIPARWIIATPIVRQGSGPDAIGFIFHQPCVETSVLLAQLSATAVVLWNVLEGGRASEQDARDSAALVEILDGVAEAPDLRSACLALVSGLQGHLKCQRAAVALRIAGKGRCRLQAISGVSQFDLNSRTACAMESAMDEAILRNDLTTWSDADVSRDPAALAHQRLVALENVRATVSTPLHNQLGEVIGALVLLDDSDDLPVRAGRFLGASEPSISRSMGIALRLEGTRLTRLGRKICSGFRSWRAAVFLSTTLALAAAMAIPIPYRLHCECQIEPIIRRFIATPFEGVLEKSLVKPGDRVNEGDLLARMDGRETRWKRASVAADQSQAIKKRDAAQAVHDYAEMQIASLEVERLELELRLLDYRAENLEIRSPLKGVVVAGDLERAEGAPLTVGQTLFEIAPLEHMVVEVAIPDEDVSFVRNGQLMVVHLDAFPSVPWQTELTRVQPRSEIRDAKNVFVAEAQLQNDDGRLSPGMKGRANLETVTKPLGWILFHKPWEFASKKLTW